jgi:hypothetical protein
MSTEAVQFANQIGGEVTRPTNRNPYQDESRSASLGIKAKLFLAFGVLAVLTVAATIVGWTVFNNINHTVTRATASFHR